MSVTEEIKSRLDIVQFLSQFLNLKKAGRNYTALCPFHNEKTPSFVIFPETQNWRCFGACGEGGDIFNFVMKREGLDFPSALRLLAERAGIELHERTPEQSSKEQQLDKLRGLLGITADFFHDLLLKSRGAEQARAYVQKRGLNEQTIAQFKIGYAPDDWRQALDHLKMYGYSEQEVIAAGVAIYNEDKGSLYDRFRNRLVIPICDGKGQVIGFGARALRPGDEPKYLNSPQTELFDKGATLFGLHLARRSIRESETAVIVEGYMDALQAHQAGFTNVVAQMGTAMTDPQLRQLSKYAHRLILALDPDAAGVKATMRGLNVALNTLNDSKLVFDPRGLLRSAGHLNMEILVVTVPDGKDPDDLIREEPQRWQALIDAAQPVVDYVIEVGTAHLTTNSTYGDREAVARELLPILLATENDLQTNYNIQRLALKLRLNEKTLIEWAQGQRRTTRITLKDKSTSRRANNEEMAQGQSESPSPERQANPAVEQERHCLAMMIRYPKFWYAANRQLRELAVNARIAQAVLGPIVPEDFTRSDFRAILGIFKEALIQDDLDPVEFLSQALPYDLHAVLEELLVEPLDAFQLRLAPSMHAQLEAERKASHRRRDLQMAVVARSEEDQLQYVVERQVLELRKSRLARENQELHFLQQEAELEMQYARQVYINGQAIRFLEQAIRQISQLQRD